MTRLTGTRYGKRHSEPMAPPWEELSRASVTEVGRHSEFVPTPLPPSEREGASGNPYFDKYRNNHLFGVLWQKRKK